MIKPVTVLWKACEQAFYMMVGQAHWSATKISYGHAERLYKAGVEFAPMAKKNIQLIMEEGQ